MSLITSCIQVLESARNEEGLELGFGDFNSVGLADWHLDYFPFHIWDNPNPIDELIFFKMVIAPPTS